jgi:hypothetical protein
MTRRELVIVFHPNKTCFFPLFIETRGGNELGSARLAARSRNEPSSARLAHLASSEKRLGSLRARKPARRANEPSHNYKSAL